MNNDPSFPSENPFCTRRIRPGSIPFLFPPGQNRDALLEKLRQNGGWGEIVGPHGSGKSTLLAEMIPWFEAEGWRIERIDLHDGQRHLPIDLRRLPELAGRRMVIVDGYEQLGFWSRFRLKRHCRRHGWGLITTSHRTVGLPDLYQTAVSLEMAVRVTEEILKNREFIISREEIAARYECCGKNLREMLFDLYDLMEQRRVRRDL